MLVVPPPLHIKLSMVNKILDALDLVVEHLDRRAGFEDADSSIYFDHISASLSNVGARRDKYECGKMSGAPCTFLMQKMPHFCSMFLPTKIDGKGSPIDLVPELSNLEANLISYATVFFLE